MKCPPSPIPLSRNVTHPTIALIGRDELPASIQGQAGEGRGKGSQVRPSCRQDSEGELVAVVSAVSHAVNFVSASAVYARQPLCPLTVLNVSS